MSEESSNKKVTTPAERLKVVKAFGKKSQQERIAVLKRAGIVNSKGELTMRYRSEKPGKS